MPYYGMNDNDTQVLSVSEEWISMSRYDERDIPLEFCIIGDNILFDTRTQEYQDFLSAKETVRLKTILDAKIKEIEAERDAKLLAPFIYNSVEFGIDEKSINQYTMMKVLHDVNTIVPIEVRDYYDNPVFMTVAEYNQFCAVIGGVFKKILNDCADAIKALS